MVNGGMQTSQKMKKQIISPEFMPDDAGILFGISAIPGNIA
jgi:hypothetical protein